MSAQIGTRRATVRDIAKEATPSVWLTAYTTPMARLFDPHVDVLLVGDSLGMVLYGLPSTLGVSLDMMINHGAAVVRGSSKSLVVVDLPFGSYQVSPEQAFVAAARVMAETQCGAVKLEGGREMSATVRYLVERGIPVCGHVGLMPQAVHTVGGFRVQGRDAAEIEKVSHDARAIAAAGAFAIVLEGVMEPLARSLTAELAIPTIGIGASPACDGQVLVSEDILGLFTDFTPRFVKRYADLAPQISQAVGHFATEVRARTFPTDAHCFGTKTVSKLG